MGLPLISTFRLVWELVWQFAAMLSPRGQTYRVTPLAAVWQAPCTYKVLLRVIGVCGIAGASLPGFERDHSNLRDEGSIAQFIRAQFLKLISKVFPVLPLEILILLPLGRAPISSDKTAWQLACLHLIVQMFSVSGTLTSAPSPILPVA